MTKKGGSEIVSISIPLDMAKLLDDAMSQDGYKNRSELVRDALRDYLDKQTDLHKIHGQVDGVLILMYAHHAEKRVHQILHDNMDIFRSFMHLDFNAGNEKCCDIIVFKGPAKKVLAAVQKLQGTKDVETIKTVLA